MTKVLIFLQNSINPADAAAGSVGSEEEVVTVNFGVGSDESHIEITGALGGKEMPVALDVVVSTIRQLAERSPAEIAAMMDTPEATSLASVRSDPVDVETLLRSWKERRPASSSPLTEREYESWLKGEYPPIQHSDLYGAHVTDR